jgi:hypothetical protein
MEPEEYIITPQVSQKIISVSSKRIEVDAPV